MLWAALSKFPQTVQGFAGTLRWLVIVGSVAVILAYTFGFIQEWVNIPSNWLYAFVLSVALLHFCYDGFIWSVRKKQV